MNMYQFVEQALGNKKKTKRTPIGGGLQAMYDGQRHFKVWRYITKYSDSPPNNIEINMIINAIRSYLIQHHGPGYDVRRGPLIDSRTDLGDQPILHRMVMGKTESYFAFKAYKITITPPEEMAQGPLIPATPLAPSNYHS